MASASEDLFAAIDAGDVDRVRATLDADPSLAMARDHEGLSALLRARYRRDRALVEAVKARSPHSMPSRPRRSATSTGSPSSSPTTRT